MATISITIPDAQAERVTKALCGMVSLEPTPANAKKAIIELIKHRVATYERETAVFEPVEPS